MGNSVTSFILPPGSAGSFAGGDSSVPGLSVGVESEYQIGLAKKFVMHQLRDQNTESDRNSMLEDP
jgi:hypothetical protein